MHITEATHVLERDEAYRHFRPVLEHHPDRVRKRDQPQPEKDACQDAANEGDRDGKLRTEEGGWCGA